MTTDLPAFDILSAQYEMLPPGAIVICAVSGGADSMCLLHLLTRREDLTLHAAHFNHHLRGEESDRDETFVRDWCETRSIPFHLGSGDVAGEAQRRKMGIEETARVMRYGFLSRLALELKADRIATAHNADDNAETLLMHLLRGTGLGGLGGIDPVRWKYVRPLLTTPRSDIDAYLNTHHIPHVEDSTNAGDDYLRNRIRHRLLPLLEEWNPGFLSRMTHTIPRLRSDNETLEELAGQLSRQAQQEGETGDWVIPAPLLAAAPDPIALRAVRQLVGEANEGDWDCSSAHLTSVLALCRSENPSGEIHLPHSLTARREYDRLILTHEGPPQSLTPFTPQPGYTPIPGTVWAVLLENDPWPGLVVRPRQIGDEITLPNGHRRSLKKLYIDKKIPRLLRDSLPLAADDEGVIAVAGLGPNLAHPRKERVTFIKITEKEENGQ